MSGPDDLEPCAEAIALRHPSVFGFSETARACLRASPLLALARNLISGSGCLEPSCKEARCRAVQDWLARYKALADTPEPAKVRGDRPCPTCKGKRGRKAVCWQCKGTGRLTDTDGDR